MIGIKSIALALVILLTVTANAIADPPPLSKADALKIIASMGLKGVNIAYCTAVSPTRVIVVAMIVSNDNIQKISIDFLYDADLGWFHSQDVGISHSDRGLVQDIDVKKIRIWSIHGYSEVAPAPVSP